MLATYLKEFDEEINKQMKANDKAIDEVR